MKHCLNLIEVNQPIGSFYIGKMTSDQIVKISKVNRRDNNNGIQRSLESKRVNEIAKYCEDPDATFPTPIVLNVLSQNVKQKNICYNDGLYRLEYDDGEQFAEILDGQHRIEGIKKAEAFQMEMLVVLMFDLTEEEKAYIFSTINNNQKKVDKSLIYDLFEVSRNRSPYKTCHEIARTMNQDKDSAFYKRLRMLGKKTQKNESLSQGTFVNYLMQLISKDPQGDMINQKNNIDLKRDTQLIFRDLYIEEKDGVILKILMNYFSAVKEVFHKEWIDDKYILSKTTGYGALIKALPFYYKEGIEQNNLSKDFFIKYMKIAKKNLENESKKLTSENFGSGEKEQKKLVEYFIEVLTYTGDK